MDVRPLPLMATEHCSKCDSQLRALRLYCASWPALHRAGSNDTDGVLRNTFNDRSDQHDFSEAISQHFINSAIRSEALSRGFQFEGIGRELRADVHTM